MVNPPEFNPICEEGRTKCACLSTAVAGKSIAKLVVNPKSPRHIGYCAATTTVCAVAWVAVIVPKIHPALQSIAVPLATTCMAANHVLTEYEVD